MRPAPEAKRVCQTKFCLTSFVVPEREAKQGEGRGQGKDVALAQVKILLGFMYLDGDGTKEDPTEAIKWFKRASEHGNVDAAKHMCYLYNTRPASGEGGESAEEGLTRGPWDRTSGGRRARAPDGSPVVACRRPREFP